MSDEQNFSKKEVVMPDLTEKEMEMMNMIKTVNAMHKDYVYKRSEVEVTEVKVDELLYQHDIGLAKFFMKHNIHMKITDAQGNGYLWCTKTKLWEISAAGIVRAAITEVLQPILNKLIFQLRDSLTSCPTNTKTIDHLNHVTRIRDKIETASGITGLFTYVIKGLIREGEIFKRRINIYDPDVLPIANGELLYVKSGQRRERTPNDLFSFECPVSFLGWNHACPNATRFFNQVFVENDELIDFAQRLFGYAMTGHTTEESFYILWGTGRNGKTTLMNLMRKILADFYSPCDKEVLLKQERNRGRDAATPGLMAFCNSRLVSTSETNDYQQLDESMVKMLTGNDPIPARALYSNPITITSSAKLMMPTNKPPAYNTHLVAMQERVKMLPFLARFTNDDNKKGDHIYPADNQFLTDLKTIHLDEVFTLLVRGAARWYDSGMIYPKICKEYLDKHNDQHDHLAMFIEECCDCKNTYKVKTSLFHEEFKKWCLDNGVETPSKIKIKEDMKYKGFIAKKSGVMHYFGIMINNLS